MLLEINPLVNCDIAIKTVIKSSDKFIRFQSSSKAFHCFCLDVFVVQHVSFSSMFQFTFKSCIDSTYFGLSSDIRIYLFTSVDNDAWRKNGK